MSCIYNLGLFLNTSCVFTNLLRPHPHVLGHFWIRNFCFRPHVSGESDRRIRNFFNLLSRVEILNTLWIRNRVDASPDIFSSGDEARTSPVLYRERQSLIRAFYDAYSVANIPRGVLDTRVNLDTCGLANSICAWTWKFLKPERKSGGLWLGTNASKKPSANEREQ